MRACGVCLYVCWCSSGSYIILYISYTCCSFWPKQVGMAARRSARLQGIPAPSWELMAGRGPARRCPEPLPAAPRPAHRRRSLSAPPAVPRSTLDASRAERQFWSAAVAARRLDRDSDLDSADPTNPDAHVPTDSEPDSEQDPPVPRSAERDNDLQLAAESLGAYLSKSFEAVSLHSEPPRPSKSRGVQFRILHTGKEFPGSDRPRPSCSRGLQATQPRPSCNPALPLGTVVAADCIAEPIMQEKPRPSCKPEITLPLGSVIALECVAAYNAIQDEVEIPSPATPPADHPGQFSAFMKMENKA